MNRQFKSLIFPEIIVFTPQKFEDSRGVFLKILIIQISKMR